MTTRLRHRTRAAGTLGKKAGWETLLNRAGTTFRKLPDKDKAGLDEKKAIALMLGAALDDQAAGPRSGGGKLLVGFKPEIYAEAVAAR